MPEAPKQNFFAKLFAANNVIDSDQLCKKKTIFKDKYFLNFSLNNLWLSLVGEAAGKAPAGVAKREDINLNQLRGKTDSANNVLHDTRMVKYYVFNLSIIEILPSRKTTLINKISF